MATRYTLGQHVLFLRVNFSGPVRFGSVFLPWEDTLKSIETYRLICAEHHAVADQQDPNEEKKYDGFVFVQEDGTRWHNQYPKASYGQLDDRQDYRVRRDPTCRKSTMTRDELLEQFGAFTDARAYLEDLYQGIHELKRAGADEKAEALESHLGDVVHMAEMAGFTVSAVPHQELPDLGIYDINLTYQLAVSK